MRKIFLFSLFICVSNSTGQISIVSTNFTYTQNFNSLASSGTSTLVPDGWYYLETGTNADGLYNTGTGSSNRGDLYSFGNASSEERAFGGVRSSTLVPTIGIKFINNSGVTIIRLPIAYTGEQWRLGSSGRVDRLDFQYSLNATSLTSGNWIDINDLDFYGPNSTGDVGAYNGNLPSNRNNLSSTINDLEIPPGATFWLRWLDADVFGSDDGLSIDDFVFNPSGSDLTTSSSFPPQPPYALLATAISMNNFTANWDSSDGATEYFLDVATDESFGNILAGYNNLNTGSSTSYSISGLLPDSYYHYRVRAGNLYGQSSSSNVISVLTSPESPPPEPPHPPIAKPATEITSYGFKANWKPPDGMETLKIPEGFSAQLVSFGSERYFLDVSTDSTFTSIPEILNNIDAGSDTSYFLSGLNAATNYFYCVKLENEAGTSGYSNIIKVSTKPEPPPPNLPARYEVTASDYNPEAGSIVTITAQLVDSSSAPVALEGKIVNWFSTNGGVFNNTTSTTDGNGAATVSFTVAELSGTVHIVSLTDNSSPAPLEGESDSIIVKTGEPFEYVLTVSDINPAAGEAILIIAQLKDAVGNNLKIAGKIIEWSSTGGGSFSNPSSTTNADGEASVNFTVSNVAGTVHRISAADNSSPTPVAGTSEDILVKAGPPDAIVVTADNLNPKAGSTIKVTAQVTDQFGNNLNQSGMEINWSALNGGELGTESTTTDSFGRSSVFFKVSNVAGTNHIVSARHTSGVVNIAGNSGNIIVRAEEADKLVVAADKYNPAAGSTVNLTAQLKDRFDNSAGVASHNLKWNSSSGGKFAFEQTETNSSGTSINQFTVDSIAGTSHIITVTDETAFVPFHGISNEIVVQPASAAKLVLHVSNLKPPAGSETDLDIQIVDRFDNPVDMPGVEMVLSSTNGGSFNKPNLLSGMNGAATAKFKVGSAAGQTHIVSANAVAHTGNLSGNSELITVVPGRPDRYIVTASNYKPYGGSDIKLTAQLADRFENSVELEGIEVSWSGTSGGSFSSKSSLTNLNGIASVDFRVNTQNATHIISASDSEGRSGKSLNINTIPIDVPALLSPANSGRNMLTDIVLQWANAPNVNSYEVVLSDKKEFEEIIFKSSLIETSVSVSLSYGKEYFWRVRGVRENIAGNWSDVWSFTTMPEFPPAPLLLSPVSGSLRVELNTTLAWTEVFDAINYEVQIDTTEDFSNAKVFSSVVNRFSISNLKPATNYYWRVRAFNKRGAGIFSAAWNFFTKDILLTPANFIAVSGRLPAVVLRWEDNCNNESGFEIERTKIGTGEFATLYSSANTNSFEDSTAEFASTYKYRIRALNQHGESNWSDEAIVTTSGSTINPPSNLTCSVMQDGSILLEWEDNSGNEEGFVLFRQDLDGPSASKNIFGIASGYNPIDTLGRNVIQYHDDKIKEGNTYFYFVAAFGVDGISSMAMANKPVTPLIAPSNLHVALGQGSVPRLNWADNSGAESGYYVERRINNEEEFVVIANTGPNISEFTDTGIPDGRFAYYRVTAFSNPYGISAYSNKASVVVPLKSPAGLEVFQLSNTSVRLLWQDRSKGEDFFVIERKLQTQNDYTQIASVAENSVSFEDNSVSSGNVYIYRVKAGNNEMLSGYSNEFSTIITTVKRIDDMPKAFVLHQNYPNPFNSTTKIRFEIPQKEETAFVPVQIILFDLLGNKIKTLIDEVVSAGIYEFDFTAENLPGGIYFYKFTAANFTQTRKMMYIK